ncbi:ATP-binding cassette domain-containing protein [Zobellia galactanivorans]|uniref:ABC transporter, ATPase component n=1 Tax=Zobellia galactanivorans (strain DSM 12802 / CCUG 47099 / CIP 106680 / NCIMB 13871 / Dsij) TaxID=63186 RepID=G0L3M3_ZOBGA|nr:ATP-binding cassette domain-containing protein [Zobellia galactanivorans]CAZ98509.1 ABC transporter, ATPase component [Zobellia galactanivorans]
MVQTDNLTFHYKKAEHTFRFPNIALKEQEHLLILGKSGIGKTTLLHLLAGLLKPASGALVIDEVAINSLSHSELDKFRGQNIGLVFQKSHAVRSLNVLDNLKARLFFSKKSINHTIIDSLLEQLDLTETKKKQINELSEGQLQRLGIAMAVVHNPQVILADEPTSNLDDENCMAVLQLLQQQAGKNRANLIVITHDIRIKSAFKNVITL